MRHEDARDLLDDLIDDALSEETAAQVKRHIAECETCRAEARSVKILSLALQKLPGEKLRSDEKLELVDKARAAATSQSNRKVLPTAWIAAAALVIALAIGLPWLISSNDRAGTAEGNGAVQSERAVEGGDRSETDSHGSAPSGPLPVVITKGGSYSDTTQIDKAVRANPSASIFLGHYRASDVGALQRLFQEYVKEQAPVSQGRSPAECMNLVFRSVPRPILPAYVERASFEGRDSWVLAFAFTDNTAPGATLDEILIYVLAQSDCDFVSTASYR